MLLCNPALDKSWNFGYDRFQPDRGANGATAVIERFSGNTEFSRSARNPKSLRLREGG
jgi:hypothetical protein